MIEKHIKDKTLIKITKELQKGKWVEIERIEIELEYIYQKKNKIID